MSNLEQTIIEMKKQLDMIVEAVCGDPTDANSPGMILRIDRLEHSGRMTRNCLWLIGSTTVVIISNLVLKYI